MNINTITTTNQKGQVVLPQKIRKTLGITQDTPLLISLSGNSITVQPISDVITLSDHENSYAHILAKTQGSWADSAKETAHDRTKELAAAKKRRKPW